MEIRETTCRTILNRTGGFLGGFTHSANPYGGCAYGRTLCGLPDYAPEILRGFGETRAWGSWLDVKTNAPDAYRADWERIRASSAPALWLYMSSVTDPYVPQERRFRLTRGILEAMRERPPDLLALQTHTPNLLWDEDLLVDLSRRFPLSAQISVETDRESMGPLFPPHAYPVAERLAALRRLRDRGMETVAVVAPLWPLEDAGAFARRLDEAASFVILDHWLLGDGSKDGARTKGRLVTPARRPPAEPGADAAAPMRFPDLLSAAGYEAWTRIETFERVRETFTGVLGPERLGVSKEGFQRAAHRLLGRVR